MADVRTEIAAKVLQVPVTDGQRVEVGDDLVVLTLENSEIPLVAPIAGVVSALVAVGDDVDEGDVVAVITE